jgi:DNA processing protein
VEDGEKLAWIRLIRSERVGPITFFQLLERFGNAGAALAALPELARRGGTAKPLRLCTDEEALSEFERTEQAGGRLVVYNEADYPALLREIADPPPVVSIIGRVDLFSQPAVAIVGARNASANGTRFSRQLAADLGAAGLVVVSGLARGIDTAAHQGGLATGTVAVVGGGIDVVYPPDNRDLYDLIAAQGVLIAEQPAGTEPRARHFPRRNRIISGLSHAIVVTEAARRSGSLITARMALEQGREVFAVPGFPGDPRAQGPNQLIKQGALLCEGAGDIVTAVSPQVSRPAPRPGIADPPPVPEAIPDAVPGHGELAEAREIVMEKLSPAPVDLDELLRQTQLTPATLLTILLEMELAGRLTRHPGNRVSAG